MNREYMKKSILFIFLITICAKMPLYAQVKKVKAWKITFGVHQELLPTSDSSKYEERSLKKIIEEENQKDKKMVCYVNKNHVRFEPPSSSQKIFLHNNQDSVFYRLDSKLKKANQYLVEKPTRMEDDSIIESDGHKYKIVYPKETKRINGYKCHKVIIYFISEPLTKIVAWYSRKIPLYYWPNKAFLGQLPGGVLAIHLYLKKLNLKVNFEAEEIQNLKVENTLFYPPEDYEIVDNGF